ncbi:MAG TPA: hypothetical protein PLR71_13380 [Deltaproteobacteria bacterium]|nr:hypothetical protein [Deltaproteobacteria bacterium]HQI82534.1 hypothetical protein [Deltaproteobacteria bacterium]
MAILGLVAVLLWAARTEAMGGLVRLFGSTAHTPGELVEFLDSPRADTRGVQVNGHVLEIGKRPSMQVLQGYPGVMYQMRPYRQANLMYRNFTKPEVVDFCTGITGRAYGDLRRYAGSQGGPAPVWKGTMKQGQVTLWRVTRFTYLADGLTGKHVFMGQVELAKRLGMDDDQVMKTIVPAQEQWLQELRKGPDMRRFVPVQEAGPVRDELLAWLQTREE